MQAQFKDRKKMAVPFYILCLILERILNYISRRLQLNMPNYKYKPYYAGAVTEGQQTSSNFHRPMLQRHKNNCINEESTNTAK
jgi:hypothetical protein